MAEPTDKTARPPASEVRYLIAVGALGVLIIAMLAVLWLRERSARRDAEERCDSLAKKLQAREVFSNILAGRSAPGPEPVSLAAVQRIDTVTIGGRQRVVIRLPADVGTRLGFQPGWLVEVAAAAATQPAAGP